MKKIFIVLFICAGLSLSPATWAGFPEAGVDNVPLLAKITVTFTKEFAIYMRDNLGIPFCENTEDCPAAARTYTTPLLYDAKAQIGRSAPHRDGDGTDKLWGADVCKKGEHNSCQEYYSWDNPVLDTNFKKDTGYPSDGQPFDKGPEGVEEVHTQIISLQLTPLEGGDFIKMRAGSEAPCQARSLGEIESLTGDGLPAEGFWQIYTDIDVDLNNDGIVDLTLFNKAGADQYNPTISGDEPIIIEATDLTRFPPKVIYHTGSEKAPKLYVGVKNRARDGETQNNCEIDPNPAGGEEPQHVGWIKMAAYGLNFSPSQDGTDAKECQNGETDQQCFERFSNGLDNLPISETEKDPSPPPTQLELEFFKADVVDGKVSLEWRTVSESGTTGFYIWRAKKANGGETVEYTLTDGTPVTELKQITEQAILNQGPGFPYKYEDSEIDSGNLYYYAIVDKVTVHLDNLVSVTVK
ncbi:MAG: hypothetical protein DRR08_30375 [Candidatus Parabeggiatoa sp. nov. 2]|nr:MAG: hypothetical protein B6247_31780 [Beggiatoa sp. 4572_84]RKZ50355.1 MAG: hypothetical protein DRR08_30375 [Gammaproteobacteria bacterium]